MPAKKSKPKYSKSTQEEVKNAMQRFKKGTAHSGKNLAPVKSKEQAIAIALSKASKEGKKVPSRKRSIKNS
jgi:hypothetical protein